MSEFREVPEQVDTSNFQKRKPIKRIGAIPRTPTARQQKTRIELEHIRSELERTEAENTSMLQTSLGIIREKEHLEEQSQFDQLTGLRNYTALRHDINQYFEEAQRYNHEMGVIEFDIDDFKKINDTLGHEEADQVLITLAALVPNYTRSSDRLYRRSGDEFFILTPLTSNGDTKVLAERIRESIQNELPLLSNHPDLPLSVSMGIAGYTPGKETNPKTIEEIFERTNIALQNSKRDMEGNKVKNKVTVYSPGMVIPPGGDTGRT